MYISYSYKNFVEDLDAGDSFTTAVIDILVQVNPLNNSLAILHC
jgi:hypothetical protein